MTIMTYLAYKLPGPVKRILKPVVYPVMRLFADKYHEELSFWKSRLIKDGGTFHNAHYQKLMLAMADEADDSFLCGKVVADFGCGPRGSLVWAKSASLRIGIDVLADRYADEFTGSILSHEMVYLKSTEKVVPLPPGFVDVMFTVNAMDHADSFTTMCDEIIRILKPGGTLIGSFNIGAPVTITEPHPLTEELIRDALLQHFDIRTYRVSKRGPDDSPYRPLLENTLSYEPGQEGLLWVRAVKKS